jgi:ubiquinone/menaquinone biosynthesis C-methylase UbiE
LNPSARETFNVKTLLSGLRAAGESTRLRLLAICAQGEVAVSELTEILDQSQPRVSRHLKLLCEEGLLQRHREGTWIFYRIADPVSDGGGGAALARKIVDMIPVDDPQLLSDRKALDALKLDRAAMAEAYFRTNAKSWDRIRALHVDAGEVEQAVLAALPTGTTYDLLDVGTGSGRILELLGETVSRGTGIDLSREMLAIARAKLATAGLDNCQLRHGDMYDLPMNNESFDAVTVHLVLHYADRPQVAIAEIARVLRPGGRIIIADFAPHNLEELRTEHAHRRLGFEDQEVREWFASAGLNPEPVRHLPGDPLTVNIWSATKQGDLKQLQESIPAMATHEEVVAL